ncbi:MAG: C13 family peptidase [Methylococcaceae bacterium]
MPFTFFYRYTLILVALFLTLLSTSAQSATKFQPDAMWPKLTQSGRYFNFPSGIARDTQGLFYITDTGSHKIKVLTAEGELLRIWGNFGDKAGQFNHPRGIAISPSGEVFVADANNSRIQVFSLTGQFLRQWGDHGSAKEQLDYPTNLVVNPQGLIIVSDTANDRIQVFDGTGRWIQTVGEGLLTNPHGMAFSPTGELYIADRTNHRISIFSVEGNYLRSFGEEGTELGQFDEPQNLAFDAQGLLYVTELGNNRVQVFNQQGEAVTRWGGFTSPVGLVIDNKTQTVYVAERAINRIVQINFQGAKKDTWQSQGSEPGELSFPLVSVNPQGNVYVADLLNDRIQVFSSTGELLQNFGASGREPGQFLFPIAVAFDSQQRVYVADFVNDRIQVFDQQGNYLRHFGVSGSGEQQLNHPRNLFINNGLLYISDLFNDRVQVFTLDGVWVRGWGEKGTGQGQFNQPDGIVVDDQGQVYVVDSGNNRIQVFDEKGTFLGQWGNKGSEPSEFNFPTGLALSPNGLLYVADAVNNRIQVFQRDGTFIESIGSAGTQAGQLAQPYSVALIDEDTLVIGERSNNRVQVLRRKEVVTSPHKAIILAGGGLPTETHFNALWDSTQLLSNNAYFALRAQGYNKDAIKFLSSGNLGNDLDENGKADDLEAATLVSLEQSITNWASDAGDVLIYLIDHGGPGTFKINQNEILSREQLKQWVDSLQSKTNGKVTVVIEACQSASFFDGLGTNNRILIASADKEQPAVISNQGMNSFSYHFWYAVHTGQPLLQAFKKAQQGMSSQTVLVNNKEQRQKAQLEADGNGLFDNADETVLGDYCLGNCQQLAADEPQLTPITTSSTLNGEIKLALSVQVTSLAPISRAWAIISRPDVNHTDLNQPITDLPQIPLLCTEQEAGKYLCQGEYPSFDVNGDYNITFYASDTQARTSVPNTSITIKQTAGKDNTLSTSKYSTLYDVKTGAVTLQDVVVEGQHYRVNLQSQNDLFVLTSVDPTTRFFEIPAQFNFESGLLAIPQVEVNGHIYSANLQKQTGEGFVFKLDNVIDFGVSRRVEK